MKVCVLVSERLEGVLSIAIETLIPFHNVHICGTALCYYSDEIVKDGHPHISGNSFHMTFFLLWEILWNGGSGHCRLWKMWRKLSKAFETRQKVTFPDISKYHLSASKFFFTLWDFFFYEIAYPLTLVISGCENLKSWHNSFSEALKLGKDRLAHVTKYLSAWSTALFRWSHWTKPGFCALFRRS